MLLGLNSTDMKKSIILLLICILFVSCDTEQRKAETLIEKYLEENLVDIDSYQNIKMDELKEVSIMGLFLQEDLRKVKNNEIDINGYEERIGGFRKSLEQKNINPDSIVAYTLEHKYRAKNSLGGYVINIVRYTFDDKLETIIDIEDLE